MVIYAVAFLQGPSSGAIDLFAPVGTPTKPAAFQHSRLTRRASGRTSKQPAQDQGLVGSMHGSTVFGGDRQVHLGREASTSTEPPPTANAGFGAALLALVAATGTALISRTYTGAIQLAKNVGPVLGQATVCEVVSQSASGALVGTALTCPTDTAMASSSGAVNNAAAGDDTAMATTSAAVNTVTHDAAPETAALTTMEDLYVGGLSGVTMILTTMPVLTWKFCIQTGTPFPTALGGWYRGVLVQASSIAPVTAVQFLFNGALKKMISGASPLSSRMKRELTTVERLVAGLGAGVVSAVLLSPVDMLTIQQQKLGLSLMGSLQYILVEAGPVELWRGVVATAAREGIYVAGMFGLTPVIGEYLTKNVKRLQKQAVLANALSACAAGVVAALLSHPMDTVKSCLQADLFGTTYTNILRTMAVILQDAGWGGLYVGVVPRTLMTVIAFYISTTLHQMYVGFKSTRSTA